MYRGGRLAAKNLLGSNFDALNQSLMSMQREKRPKTEKPTEAVTRREFDARIDALHSLTRCGIL